MPTSDVSSQACGLKIPCSPSVACLEAANSTSAVCIHQEDISTVASLSCDTRVIPKSCSVALPPNQTFISYSLRSTDSVEQSYSCDRESQLEPCDASTVKTLECVVDCSNLTHCVDFFVANQRAQAGIFSATFVLIFILEFISNICTATTMPIVEAITLETVEKDETKYGHQRVWGSIGFGLTATAVGGVVFLIGMYKTCPVVHFTDFNPYFYFYFVSISCCAVSSFFLKNAAPPESPKNLIKKVLRAAFGSGHVVIFFVVMFVTGMLTGIYEAFVFLYFHKMLNATPISVGLSVTVACLLAETPMMFFSGKIMTLISQSGCLCIALFAWAVRFFLYTIIDNCWLQIPIEMLHGLTFGLLHPAASTFAAKVSPPGTTATMQSITQSVHFGISKGLGSMLGGAILSSTNFQSLFYFSTGLAFITAVLYTVYSVFYPIDFEAIAARFAAEAEDAEAKKEKESDRPDEPSPKTEELEVFLPSTKNGTKPDGNHERELKT
jgi:predicted MFS family arabinose efflux permease